MKTYPLSIGVSACQTENGARPLGPGRPKVAPNSKDIESAARMHYFPMCARTRNSDSIAKLVAKLPLRLKMDTEMAWTEDRVKTLVQLREEGKTASQIAEILGDTTRNAVIGKIFRLGLAKPMQRKPAQNAIEDQASPRQGPPENALRQDPPRDALRGAADTAERAPLDASCSEADADSDVVRSVEDAFHVVGMEEAINLVKRAEREAKKLDLLELTERTCKWPVGDPSTSDFWFCGLPSKAGKPYCKAHIGIAYQPFTSRRDSRSSASKR